MVILHVESGLGCVLYPPDHHRPDLDFVSEPLDSIEDRDWSEPDVPGSDQARRERMHRRRLMQTTIDLRNLS